ncbi:unnamed protein product [Adineta ricciae]|uniref:Uncharacterized protein n=1 Tax=Adineta ricciae TaxID=249248 RepID=A0A815AM47_ADIRI|nr:unnamed protein product [Adineta ricciae]
MANSNSPPPSYDTVLPSISRFRARSAVRGGSPGDAYLRIQQQILNILQRIHFRLHPRKKYKHPVEVKVEKTIIKPLDATQYLDVIIDKTIKVEKSSSTSRIENGWTH